MLPHVWQEYDWAAEWVARRPEEGGALPRALSETCRREIDRDPEAFARRVRETRYMLAMESLNLPET